ncbi:MAG: T9SS type A sorting domain-containing protein [Saprospiraceae bacterium]
MHKHLSYILLFLSLSLTTIAQKEDYRWMLGSPDGTPYNKSYFGGMDLDFNNGEVKIIINHKPYYMNSHNASICDKNGEIIFYTDGCYLLDSDNNKIPGSDSLNPINDYYENCIKEGLLYPSGLEIPQGGIILPKLTSKTNYFYLSLETVIGKKFLYSPHVLLTELIYSDSSNLFTVLFKNEPILKDTLPTGSMTAVKMKNDLGWWIIIRKDQDNLFFIINNSADTIKYKQQKIGEYFKDGDLEFASFSPNGKHYAYYSSKFGLELMDFDRELGIFSNYRKISVIDTLEPGICGVCFSPDNRYVYVSTRVDLFQYDITASDIKSSEVFVASTNNVSCDPGLKRKTRFGPMVLGPDCRIYMVSNYQQTCMNVIMHPNNKGTACEFVQQAIQLPFLNHSSIPNFPHFRIDEPYPCESTIKFLTSQIDEFDFSSSLVYYPNPITDHLNILFPHPLEVESYLGLYDITGRIHKYEKIANYSSEVMIDCDDLSSGIYFFQIKSINGAFAGGKFIK